MSKRDDDGSSSDMELGMTTAERRRRRRRGGGLRVPSNNVPRRTTTAPPVAPVPEDPALAMSIAYSFSNDASQPIQRSDDSADSDHSGPASFDPVAPEAVATVIDPPSAPVESADFEMKTREMSAIDLEALGLDESMIGGVTNRVPRFDPNVGARASSPNIEVEPTLFETKTEAHQTMVPRPPILPTLGDQPSVIIDQSLESIEPITVPPVIIEPVSDQVDVDIGGLDTAASTLDTPAPGDSADIIVSPIADAEPEIAADGDNDKRPRRERIKTVALSDDDLEEVREAIRQAESEQRARTSQPVPTVVSAEEGSGEPMSVPDIDIHELAERADAADAADAVEVEVEVEAKPPPRPSKPSGMHETLPGDAPRARAPSIPPPIAHATPPPPPPAATAKPPAPPPPVAKKEKPAAAKPVDTAKADAKPDGKGEKRGKPWFVDLFDEDYLRTLPFLTPQATQAEAEFVIDAMGLSPGAQVLDVGCGYGRHAMELAARGFHVVGLDMSTPLLVRGGEEAHRRGLTINFIRGDMRELDFDAQFDGAYCLFSTFGYFDDETNKKTAANIARALKPGGRVMFEILNRDYVIADLPTRVWWEGEGCVVLEEVELNYFSSRIQVNRSVVFDDGRQLEQEISVRAYSLHEVGKLMHSAGFRVLEVSGGYHTRGRFFGNQSRHIIVLAERKDSSTP